LKKYILSKGWIDRDDMDYDEQIEEQDEKLEEENERFETKYNFRFEEQGSTKVKTFARKIEESVRQKEATRADKKRERK
jgi:protein KRI1